MTESSLLNYTARILNYVNPYYINGKAKSAFYTEVNTNLQINDKVFILNGYNDSEVFIKKGKYVKNADGYLVLYVDRCMIVLDIDYNGVSKSYTEDKFDNYLKVHHISTQREFDYINKVYIDSYTSGRKSKFELNYTNDIIYADSAFFGIPVGVGTNNGLSSDSQFWARSGLNWVNVTSNIEYNIFNFTYDYYTAGLTNNGRLYIVGEDFQYLNTTFKQRSVYKYTPDGWIIDTIYKQPIITKLNFRQGIFKGTHNDGVFGTYLNSQDWYGTQSIWNSGFMVNSNWISGEMNSKSDNNTNASYYASIQNGLPVQTSDFLNNRGYGYNYILDSNIYSGQIDNGSFINCNIGLTGTGLTAVDIYFGSTYSYPLNTLGGLYDFCNISDTKIENSTLIDSVVNNVYLNNTKSLNSQLNEVYSNTGEFSVESGVSIISADIISYLPEMMGATSGNTGDIRGVLKLYISSEDFNRLDNFDNFYITNIKKSYIINSLTSDQKIYLPYETRYILDTFFDFKVNGINQECFCTLKTISDNININEVNHVDGYYINNRLSNTNLYCSIDIDLGQYLAFYNNGNQSYNYLNQSIITKLNVQNLFLKTNISNADFKSGISESITWTSGSIVNYPSNIIAVTGSNLNITRSSSTQIDIYLSDTVGTINDNFLGIGKYAWLDSIFYTDTSDYDISGVYRISQLVSTLTGLKVSLTSNTLSSVPDTGGYFHVPDVSPKNVSIHRILLDNAKVNSGLFSRTLFKRSTFENNLFISNDKKINLSNINLIRLINLVINDPLTNINSGVVYKSHILKSNWNNGILYNSIWNGPDFNGGVFNNGYWIKGSFNSGSFINSRGITLSTVDYSNSTYYNNWYSGTFNNGEFYNSVWLDGVWNNGKLYNSDWYGGTWNNGVLGDVTIPILNTTLGYYSNLGVGATQTFWYGGYVDNAQIGGNSPVYWYDGNFNNGVFISYGDNSLNESIWYDGKFNGGLFTGLSRWKNGVFNNGKFTSYYGWTYSSSVSSTQSQYSWENGTFNNGQFGVANYGTNSSWFSGVFSGGIFQGRVWNSGVFQNGNFYGGSTYSIKVDESSFVLSFTSSFYGLWRSGWVVDKTTLALSGNHYHTDIKRSTDTSISTNFANFENMLWVYGTFSHNNGVMYNSAWLSGSFQNGNFNYSLFNPYIDSNYFINGLGGTVSFNRNAIWSGGNFNGGTFYYSDWLDGIFMSGTMSGGAWRNGTWNYGEAKNIYWENGFWKNGMWNGSPFNYLDVATSSNVMFSGKNKDILLRVASLVGSSNMHLINAFTGSYTDELVSDPNINYGFSIGWTYSDTSSNLDNWNTDTGEIYIDVAHSNPSLTLISSVTNPSANTTTQQFQVGSNIKAGDTFSLGVYSGSAVVTAVSGDTPNTIANKLSNLINLGRNNYVIQYYSYVNYPPYNVSLYGRWQDCPGAYNYWNSTGGPFARATFIGNTITTVIDSVHSFGGYAQSGSYTYNPSEVLYVLAAGPTTSIFTEATSYVVELDVSNSGGTTEFNIYIGNSIQYESISGYTTASYKFNYLQTEAGLLSGKNFMIQKIIGQNPQQSRFAITYASVKTTEVKYDQDYNNKLWNFIQTDISLYYDSLINNTYLTTFDGAVQVGDFISIVIGSSCIPNQTFTYSVSGGDNITNVISGLITSVDISSNYSATASSYNGRPGLIITPNNNTCQISGQTLITSNNNILSFTSGTIVNLPTNIILESVADNNLISLNFGNGYFKSGIWNNGIWNNGWHAPYIKGDSSVYLFSSVYSLIKTDMKTWELTLNALNGTSQILPGSNVSIGNIVAIDVNSNRRLLKDYYRVLKVTPISITVEILVNFSLRTIQQDSYDHLIYVSNNIWISGVFYNGYFKGIWNYGLFQGYPYLTMMEDTHMIDGIFNGGHFKGNTSSYLSTNNLIVYDTSLVQNFYFLDNNKSGPYQFLYDSWIDVPYSTQSMVNLGIDRTRYGQIGSGISTTFTDYDLRGYPVKDILSSNSIFRNGYDTKSRHFTLGTKYTVYTNYTAGSSPFTTPFSSRISPGISKFINAGWTFSPANSSTYYECNVGGDPYDVLVFSTSDSASGYQSFLDNTNTSLIEKGRYSIVQFQFTAGTSASVNPVNLLNLPATYSINQSVINHLYTNDYIKKEYFYNRRSLQLLLQGVSPSYSLYFNDIQFLESDMIPFFIYSTESNINNNVRNPLYGTISNIDYQSYARLIGTPNINLGG